MQFSQTELQRASGEDLVERDISIGGIREVGRQGDRDRGEKKNGRTLRAVLCTFGAVLCAVLRGRNVGRRTCFR